jgi:hypothetical protein
MFRSFGILAAKEFLKLFGLSNLLILSVHDEGDSRNAPFLLQFRNGLIMIKTKVNVIISGCGYSV